LLAVQFFLKNGTYHFPPSLTSAVFISFYGILLFKPEGKIFLADLGVDEHLIA
jgi:hypothetical protein